MTWLLVVGCAWALLSLPVALLIGRSVRAADRREAEVSWVPDYIPAGVLASVRTPRRS